MIAVQKLEAEKSVLRWGGLGGILGSITFIIAFIFVGVFIGLDPAETAGWIVQFPDIRAARIVENSLFLVVLILWVTHFLALYHALRGTGLAPALFGSVIGILGLVVLAAEALQHIAQAPIANLYHAPGITAEHQQILVFLWEATQGIFDAMFITGLVILPIGLVILGVAMFRSPAFGTGFGGTSVALGLLGIGAAILLLVDPDSVPGSLVGVFALIGFNFVLGWKTYTLSRVS